MFGGITVHSKHAQFQILENGLIQFSVTNTQALENTLINGKQLSAD